MDYIDVFRWFMIIGIMLVVCKKVWDMLTDKKKKKAKWEDFLED